ncbi:kininogen-1 isoform X1 [Microtus pennsylvanicus]|uniref:kininogen-1 isoform X1 n=1 Tax=Microtus pennsylvanicus TaxID=10058 RepID=UPI003F6D4FF7
MKLVTILFLCSRLLLSLAQEESTEEIDCNDEDVFQAVDAALKKYNARNQTGYQFVLYRVTEGTKMVGSDTFYSFKYQIKEGNCPVQSGLSWQDCDYKDAEEAATGECTATVGKRGAKKFSVATQTCNITPGNGPVLTAQYTCLGCVHPIPPDSPELEPVLKHAVEHFNNNSKHTHLFALEEVKAAQRQVVAGMNFEITYSIVQTNCSKEQFQFLSPECKSLADGDFGECRDNAYVDIKQNVADFSQDCNIYPGEDLTQPLPEGCFGCPKSIPVDSPVLTEPLSHAIKKLNTENNHSFYFKIDTVKKATSQVVGGMRYFIEFIARETKCSKESNTELKEDCEVKSPGQSLSCSANVYMRPWENKVEPTVKCQVLEVMMRRPPGFSPFRSVQVQEAKEGTTVSPPYTAMVQEEQDAEHERRPAEGHEKQKKHKIDHGHKHGHDQGHRPPKTHGLGNVHQKQHGLGHGHQKQHGLGHGHQLKLDYLKPQREDNFDHEHREERVHKHGHGHGKHKNHNRNNGKQTEERTEPLVGASEDSSTSSIQTQGWTAPSPPLAQPSVTVTPSDFQNSDLIDGEVGTTPPYAPETYDDLIPEIRVQPDSLSFKLISDFPEAMSPKCPGRPWKPVSTKDPATEMGEFSDFDLTDALS